MDNVLDFYADRQVPISVHHDSSSPGRASAHEVPRRLSWIVLDTVVPDSGDIPPEWQALICKFPDRIVVGSDSVADPATITHRAEQITRLLQTLPRSVAQAVGTDTAGELWFS